MWRSIRLSLLRWRGQKHGIINCLSEVSECWEIAPQMGDNHLLVYDSSVFVGVSAAGRECNTDDTVRVTESWRNFKVNEGGVRNISNGQHNLRARVGVVCHDGSYLFWEWDEKRSCFMPLALSNP
jgi:hypothetical protein